MAILQPVSPVLASGRHASGLILGIPFRNRSARDRSGKGHDASFAGTTLGWAYGPRGDVLRHGSNDARTTFGTLPFSLTAGTFILGMRKTDATNRTVSAFGVPLDTTKSFGALLPYSDGTVYWDWGGTTVGSTRVQVAGLTFGDDIWAFSVGPRGMEIWQNGILRASNSATPTRTTGAGVFGLANYTGGSDLADFDVLLAYDHQLPVGAIRDLSSDPWAPFRDESEAEDIAVLVAASAGGGTAGNASGTVPSLTINAPSGSATGAASASGTAPALTIASPSGVATGAANAAGAAPSLTINAPAGSATGAASATGTAPSLTVGAPSASATGSATATGSAPSLTINAPDAIASGGGPGTASGSAPSLTVNSPAGTATGAAVAAGAAPSLTISAPAGTATGASAASGSAPSLTISAPSGSATGAASASGSAPSLAISAPAATATGGTSTPGNASGAAPSLTISAPAATATGTGVEYNVYRNDGAGGPVDYSTPIATTTNLSYVGSALASPSDTTFAVRATDATHEEKNVDCRVRVVIDSGGNDVSAVPDPVAFLSASASSGGNARVDWMHVPTANTPAATGFKVWLTAGLAVNYAASPSTTVAAVPRLFRYSATVSGLSDGVSYSIGVRAFNATATEPGTTRAGVVGIASAPTAVASLTGSASYTH